jgi:hypothetical protein
LLAGFEDLLTGMDTRFPSERVLLPIIEGLTKIRFAPTETLLDFVIYLSKEEINDAR